jgi:hypothetical protein
MPVARTEEIAMQFFTDAEISRQELLADGTLLCRGVAVGRCGSQRYHSSELMLDGDYFVDVWRDEGEVFDLASMASFEGKPIRMGHDGTTDVGIMGNIRRKGSLLIADLWVKAKRAVDAIRQQRWRGLSLGYEADYAPGPDGRYRQRNIRGDHVALLDPATPPRCGSACMIGDSASMRGRTMTSDQGGPGAYVSGAIGHGEQGAMRNVGGIAGPVNVMKLDGSVAEFDIIENAQGEVWLVRFPLQRGSGYGGVSFPLGGGPGDHPRRGGIVGDGQQHAVATYRQMQAADAAKLKAMADANAAYWAKKP